MDKRQLSETDNHFADPEFDGEPIQIYEPGDDDSIVPPEEDRPIDGDLQPDEDEEDELTVVVDEEPEGDGEFTTTGPVKTRKVYVDGAPVSILAERVEYLD